MKKKYKIINTILAIMTAFLLLGVVVFKILFPVFVFKGNSQEVAVSTFGDKQFLVVKIKKGYPFYRLEIQMVNDGKISDKKIFGKVYQDELGLYPVSHKISTISQLNDLLKTQVKGIKKGELLSDGKAVYFIDGDNSYRAFIGAEVFDVLGFDWSKIKMDKLGVLSTMTRNKNINLNTTYLPFSFVMVGQRLFLIGDNKERYLIDSGNKQLLKYVENNFSIIKNSKRRLDSIGELSCFNKRKLQYCFFENKKHNILPRATVVVELKDNTWQPDNHTKIVIHTFDKWNSLVPRITLRRIKQTLIIRYGNKVKTIKNVWKK